MEIGLQILFSCLLLGGLSGFLAGLLGIGGGLVIVPALIVLLPATGMAPQLLMPIALGTSLAAILMTSFSSLMVHRKLGNIPWPLMPTILWGVGLGALAGSHLADMIPSDDLRRFFALFVLVMAAQMFFDSRKAAAADELPSRLPGTLGLGLICAVIGVLASLLGIGGGVLLVPLLSWCRLELRQAIGASAASGLMIATMGSIGYLWAGTHTEYVLPDWSLGYIYLPALVGITAVSLWMAPLGVKTARVLPVKLLKRCFAALLLVVGIRLLLS